MKVEVVLPPCSDDYMSDHLCALTEAVCKVTGDIGVGVWVGHLATGRITRMMCSCFIVIVGVSGSNALGAVAAAAERII